MDYAIIKLGNKQHRVRDGETLVVDRLHTDAGASFEPVVLLGDAKVTAKVLAHERGPKILIGKYRKRTGYKRHNGFRAATSRVEISLAGGTGGGARKPAAAKAAPADKAITTPVVETPVNEAPVVETAVVETAVVETPAIDIPAVDDAAVAETSAGSAAAEAAAAPDAAEAPALGLPDGYDGMTVAQITAAAKGWSAAELDAAVAYEREHAGRKGALTALEAALAKEER